MKQTLEIVEGPGAGTQLPLTGPIVIGRDAEAELVLEDNQASRRHARVTPVDVGAVVEDLDSTNGTLVNGHEVYGRASLSDGDELVIGVTVLQLHALRAAEPPSGVRAVPPALAAHERRPTFTDPITAPSPPSSGIPELERLSDRRVRSKARMAPLAVFVLAALVVVIYLGVTST